MDKSRKICYTVIDILRKERRDINKRMLDDSCFSV